MIIQLIPDIPELSNNIIYKFEILTNKQNSDRINEKLKVKTTSQLYKNIAHKPKPHIKILDKPL